MTEQEDTTSSSATTRLSPPDPHHPVPDHSVPDQAACDQPTSDQHSTEPHTDSTDFKFSPEISLEQIRALHAEFVAERGWEKYHSPRNLLLALVGEVGELAELFQWRGEVGVGLPDWTPADRDKLAHELSDVLAYVVRLADRCRVDLPAAFINKMAVNREHYPASRVYGSSRKYTEYEESEK